MMTLSLRDETEALRSDDELVLVRETGPEGRVGLSISRSIIDRHGGRLWVEANAGQGATFRFALAGIS